MSLQSLEFLYESLYSLHNHTLQAVHSLVARSSEMCVEMERARRDQRRLGVSLMRIFEESGKRRKVMN